MKTAEEIINNLPDLESGFNDFYGRQTLIEAIEQAQKEAYNQAIEDAIGNVTLSLFDYEIGGFKEYKIQHSHYIINDGNYIEVDKDSILKLKK